MRVVLDTNILYRKYRLDSPELTVLARAAQGLDHSVLVPEVVLDELTGQWRAEMAKAFSTLDDSGEKLRRLTEGRVAVSSDGWDLDALASEYRKWLEMDLLLRFGAEVLPYPAVSHENLAASSILRRRPFAEICTRKKKHVTGYRDALIWASILEVLGREDTDIALVSHDRSAFGSADGNGLHEELVEDLYGIGHDADVIWFDGLEEFLAQEVTPRLEHLEALLGDLKNRTHEMQKTVEGALDERLLGLRGLEVEHLRGRGITIEGHDPRLSSIEPRDPWRFKDAIGLDDATYIIKAQRDVMINYEAMDEDPEREGVWYAREDSAPARAEVACFLNPETGETSTSAASFRPIPVPPQAELTDLEAEARNGDADAIRRIVELVRLHPGNSDLILDGIPLIQGQVLDDLVSGSPERVTALAQVLRRTLAVEGAWGRRDFNYGNDVLGWLLDVTKAALASQDRDLAVSVADTLFSLEPEYQRFALRRRTRPWLLSLGGEAARTIATALGRRPEEVEWLRADGWEPGGGSPAIRNALGLEEET